MVDKLSKICSECPRKNPVEDIWLQTKNFMIAFDHLCSSFKIVKWLFKFFVDGQIFDFPKLFQYGILPQPPRELLYIRERLWTRRSPLPWLKQELNSKPV